MEIAYGVNTIFYDYHKEKGFTFYLNVRAVLFHFPQNVGLLKSDKGKIFIIFVTFTYSEDICFILG